MNDLGKRLKEIREEKGFPQKTVAEFLGLHRSNYSKIENDLQKLNAEQLTLFCQFCDVSADYILGLTVNNQKVYRMEDVNAIISNLRNIENILK